MNGLTSPSSALIHPLLHFAHGILTVDSRVVLAKRFVRAAFSTSIVKVFCPVESRKPRISFRSQSGHTSSFVTPGPPQKPQMFVLFDTVQHIFAIASLISRHQVMRPEKLLNANLMRRTRSVIVRVTGQRRSIAESSRNNAAKGLSRIALRIADRRTCSVAIKRSNSSFGNEVADPWSTRDHIEYVRVACRFEKGTPHSFASATLRR